MRKSHHLFQLIQAMTPSEKAYFKRHAGLHVIGEQNNYVRLFDVISKQKEYNEEKIKNKFKGEAFVKQLSVAKNYLYNLILKYLESYHHNTKLEIQSLINSARILLNKALFEQAQKVLDKAHKMAIKQNDYTYIYTINELSISIESRLMGSKQKYDKIYQLLAEQKESLKKLENENQYHRLVMEMLELNQKFGLARSEGAIKQLDNVLNKTALQDETLPQTLPALRFFYQTHLLYYNTRANIKVYDYSKKVVELAEKHPKIFKENTATYIKTIYNHLFMCLNLGKLEEFNSFLKKLKNIKSKEFRHKVDIFFYYNNISLFKCLTETNIDKILQLVKQIEKDFPKYEAKMLEEHRMMLFFQISYVLILSELPEKAQYWVDKILALPNLENRNDLNCIARIMDIVTHFERNETNLLASKIRNTHRFLVKKERFFKIEEAFIRFFRKMERLHHPTQKNMKQSFEELQKDIRQIIAHHPNERKFLQYFDVLFWLKSKISGKSMRVLLQE